MKRHEVTGGILLIIAGVIWLSWYLIDVARQHSFEQALRYLTSIAINIEFADEMRPRSPTAIVVENAHLDEGFWRKLARFDTVRSLTIRTTKITDADAKRLATFYRLEEVCLPGCKVSSTGFDELAKLQNLRLIDVSHTDIDDDGAIKLISTADSSTRGIPKYVKLRPNLKGIDLVGTKVSPEFLEYMAIRHPGFRINY